MIYPYARGWSVPIRKLKWDADLSYKYGLLGDLSHFPHFFQVFTNFFLCRSREGANLTLFIPDNVNKIGQMGQDVFKL